MGVVSPLKSADPTRVGGVVPLAGVGYGVGVDKRLVGDDRGKLLIADHTYPSGAGLCDALVLLTGDLGHPLH